MTAVLGSAPLPPTSYLSPPLPSYLPPPPSTLLPSSQPKCHLNVIGPGCWGITHCIITYLKALIEHFIKRLALRFRRRGHTTGTGLRVSDCVRCVWVCASLLLQVCVCDCVCAVHTCAHLCEYTVCAHSFENLIRLQPWVAEASLDSMQVSLPTSKGKQSLSLCLQSTSAI